MVIISNKQRDDIIRHLEFMGEALQGQDARTLDMKRLARNLAGRLKSKQPFPASCLTEKLKNFAKIK